jgi:hypothetical protein
MIMRRASLLIMCITLVAFGLRAASLDTQSMWRDEIDTLCFAYDFWDILKQSIGRGPVSDSHATPKTAIEGQISLDAGPSLSSSERPSCQSTPGLSRVDPAQGLLSTMRALLTLEGWNGPLYTVAMRPWIGLTGDTPFAARYSSLIFGVLAVPLTYVLGRRLLGSAVGLVGALLVALSPHLVWYSQEAKMYAFILVLGLLAVYALRRALDEPAKGLSGRKGSSDFRSLAWWAVMVSATSLAVYTHILAALLIPLEVMLGLIWWPLTRRHWRGALIGLACLTLPYLPLLVWQARSWLLPAGEATLFTVGRLDTIVGATFEGWAGNFVGEPWTTAILAGLGLLALIGVAWVPLTRWGTGTENENRNGRGDTDGAGTMYSWRNVLALLVWMLLPLLGIWFLSMRQPIFTNRYLVWAAPALYLLAATGYVVLFHRGRVGAIAAIGLLLLVLVGDAQALQYQAGQPIKPDFRSAAAYLEEHYRPGDLIVFHLSYMENNFDFYFTGNYDGWGAPAPASGWSEADIDQRLRANTSGRGAVWLVLSEAQMWDPQGLVKAWMDAHAVGLTHEQVFAHVSVFRYILDE